MTTRDMLELGDVITLDLIDTDFVPSARGSSWRWRQPRSYAPLSVG